MELYHRVISFVRACNTFFHNNVSAHFASALTPYISLFLLPLPVMSFGAQLFAIRCWDAPRRVGKGGPRMYIICQLYRTCLLDIPGNLVMTDVITLILSHWDPVFLLFLRSQLRVRGLFYIKRAHRLGTD